MALRVRMIIVGCSALLVCLACGSVAVSPTADGRQTAAQRTQAPVQPLASAATATATLAAGTYLPVVVAEDAARVTPTAMPTVTPIVTGIPAFHHIFVIVLENREYLSVIGNPAAPYFNSLASQYAEAGNYYGVRHPSLPNYLAMIGGDTFGVTSDCTDCFVSAPNLVDQLETAGKSWKAYIEDMPSACFIGNSGSLYAQKHNPFIYYDDIRTDPARCNKIVPFTTFATDLQQNTLPDFTWITPNMCNDEHDCSIAKGEAWMQQWVPQILASPAWKDQGALFITYDEGTTDAGCCQNAVGGHIPTLVISPLGQPGFTSPVAYNHYSLLRTIETAWQLPLLGHASCDCTSPMVDFFAAHNQ